MKLRWIITFFFTALLGGVMHELYSFISIPLVSLFAPINESVWEHLKLLFWPFLLACVTLPAKNRQRLWGAALFAELAMPLLLLCLYYLLNSGFGVASLSVDIILYFAVLAFGFLLIWWGKGQPIAEKLLGPEILLVAFYAASLILFSIAAPNLPIFIAGN